MDNKNPKLRKNGGNGTFFGNLLRGIVDVGKTVSPQLKSLLDNFEKNDSLNDIEKQLAQEKFDENELKFLLAELDKDKQELIEVTKRWTSDNLTESWLARNVRPSTLVLYNFSVILFIALDSYVPDFTVKSMWINILISNTGIVNAAYFGSRHFEKKDKIKNGYN